MRSDQPLISIFTNAGQEHIECPLLSSLQITCQACCCYLMFSPLFEAGLCVPHSFRWSCAADSLYLCKQTCASESATGQGRVDLSWLRCVSNVSLWL